jgi:hypothetical protein
MPFNFTEIISLTPEEALVSAHKATAMPSLIIGLVSLLFVFLVIGLLVFNTSNGRKKLFITWVLCLMVGGVIFIFLANSPETVQSLYKSYLELFS